MADNTPNREKRPPQNPRNTQPSAAPRSRKSRGQAPLRQGQSPPRQGQLPNGARPPQRPPARSVPHRPNHQRPSVLRHNQKRSIFSRLPRVEIQITPNALLNIALAISVVGFLIFGINITNFVRRHNQFVESNYSIDVRTYRGEQRLDSFRSNRESVKLYNNIVYVNITRLAPHLQLLTITGRDSIKFIAPGGDNNHIEVFDGRSEFSLNGQQMRLNAPIIVIGRNVFVPADLFWYYSVGVDVVFDPYLQTLNIIHLLCPEQSTYIRPVTINFEFIYSSCGILEPIVYPDYSE